MARPTDPNFGADFASDGFRSAILSTMQMGAPNAVQDKATFFFEQDLPEYSGPVDPGGLPYDLASVPASTDSVRDPVLVDVSVVYEDRASVETRLGSFDTPRATLTVLDVEYEKIQGATAVSLGGDMYDVRYVKVSALFDVNVYEIECESRGEQ